MATMGESLIASAASKAVSAPAEGIKSGIDKGIELAQMQQKAESDRKKFEQEAEKIKIQKAQLMTKSISDFATATPTERKNLRPALMQQGLDLGTPVAEGLLEAIEKEPDTQNAWVAAQGLIEELGWSKERAQESLQFLMKKSGYQKGLDQFLKQGKDVLQARSRSEGKDLQRDKFEQAKKQRLSDVGLKLKTQVTGVFKKISEEKSSLKSSSDALDNIKHKVDRGIELSKEEVGQFFGIQAKVAKTLNSGALSDQDVKRIARLPGIRQRGKDFFFETVGGTVNPDLVSSLQGIIKVGAQGLDAKSSDLAKQQEASFDLSEFSPGERAELRRTSGLDSFLAPTLGEEQERNKARTKAQDEKRSGLDALEKTISSGKYSKKQILDALNKAVEAGKRPPLSKEELQLLQ